jgi:hypothetical protein
MIALTLDIDWSPDEIVNEVVGVIDDAGVPATLFCTDPGTDRSGQSSSLASRFGSRHELGLHPNFQYTADYAGVFDRLMKIYPSVKGFRSHQGCSGWPITVEALRRGLVYEASASVFPVPVPAFKVYGNASDPYLLATRFMDAQMLSVGSFDWNWSSLRIDQEVMDDETLYIFCFHPNILYYDMKTDKEYIKRKPEYHQVRSEDSFRQRAPSGAMKLLRDMLKNVRAELFTTVYGFGLASRLWLAEG